jgi:hypothetical protein
MMRLGLALVSSTLFHVGASWALLAQVLVADLPEPWRPEDRIICVFPQDPFDYRALILGLTRAEVRRGFERIAPTEEVIAEMCVRYTYRSGSEITVLFSEDVATKVSFGPTALSSACRRSVVTLLRPRNASVEHPIESRRTSGCS